MTGLMGTLLDGDPTAHFLEAERKVPADRLRARVQAELATRAAAQVPLNALYSSEDGECFDDVNAAVWQMYFNVAMKARRHAVQSVCRRLPRSHAVLTASLLPSKPQTSRACRVASQSRRARPLYGVASTGSYRFVWLFAGYAVLSASELDFGWGASVAGEEGEKKGGHASGQGWRQEGRRRPRRQRQRQLEGGTQGHCQQRRVDSGGVRQALPQPAVAAGGTLSAQQSVSRTGHHRKVGR